MRELLEADSGRLDTLLPKRLCRSLLCGFSRPQAAQSSTQGPELRLHSVAQPVPGAVHEGAGASGMPHAAAGLAHSGLGSAAWHPAWSSN